MRVYAKNGSRRALRRVAGVLLLPALVWNLSASRSGAERQPAEIDDARLGQAFDVGRSLAVVQVLESNRDDLPEYEAKAFQPFGRGPRDRYSAIVRVTALIVAGDLREEDVAAPLHVANSRTRDVLVTGATYALFLVKYAPHRPCQWAHLDDFVRLDTLPQPVREEFLGRAKRAYEMSPIRAFRQGRDSGVKDLARIPSDIRRSSEDFRSHPEKRVAAAKELWSSVLGSRPPMQSVSSRQEWAPPDLPVTAGEVVALLGEPVFRRGWTYFWVAGTESSFWSVDASETHSGIVDRAAGSFAGVFSMSFNRTGSSYLVLYQPLVKEDWIGASPQRGSSANTVKP